MDKEKVLDVLAREWAITPITDNELTLADVREALQAVGSKNSKEFATRRMKSLVDEGMLQRREVKRKEGGGRQFAYSPAEGKTWEDVLQYIKVN